MSRKAVRVVEEIQQALTAGDVIAALDDDTDQTVRRIFMRVAEPDFDVVMLGPGYSPARLEYAGFDGLVVAWRDWTSAFQAFRIEIDEMISAGEKVVSLVTMTGKMREGGAEISEPAAAVWTVADGRLRRVEFHLDRDAALRAAGLEPADRSDR